MRGIVTRGLGTGVVLAASAAGAMMIAGRLGRGSPWARLNALAAAVGAGRRRVGDRFDPAVTPVGIAVLAGGLLASGLLYQGALAVAGAATARLRRAGEDQSMRASITELIRDARIDESIAAAQRPPADS